MGGGEDLSDGDDGSGYSRNLWNDGVFPVFLRLSLSMGHRDFTLCGNGSNCQHGGMDWCNVALPAIDSGSGQGL